MWHELTLFSDISQALQGFKISSVQARIIRFRLFFNNVDLWLDHDLHQEGSNTSDDEQSDQTSHRDSENFDLCELLVTVDDFGPSQGNCSGTNRLRRSESTGSSNKIDRVFDRHGEAVPLGLGQGLHLSEHDPVDALRARWGRERTIVCVNSVVVVVRFVDQGHQGDIAGNRLGAVDCQMCVVVDVLQEIRAIADHEEKSKDEVFSSGHIRVHDMQLSVVMHAIDCVLGRLMDMELSGIVGGTIVDDAAP